MSQDTEQSTEQSIREWFRTWERCIQNFDYATVQTLMAEDVVAFSTLTNMMVGSEAYTSQQLSAIWPNIRDFTFNLNQCHWGASGDLAWAMVPWDSTGFHPDGTSFPRPGRSTVVFERRNGTWLAIHLHFSLAPETPPKTHGPRG